jgi:hypothetical protein
MPEVSPWENIEPNLRLSDNLGSFDLDKDFPSLAELRTVRDDTKTKAHLASTPHPFKNTQDEHLKRSLAGIPITFRSHFTDARQLLSTSSDSHHLWGQQEVKFGQAGVVDTAVMEALVDNTFTQELKRQMEEMLEACKAIAKNPVLLPKGALEMVKDLTYKLPKSFFVKNEFGNKGKELVYRAAQALGMSEVIGALASEGTDMALAQNDVTNEAVRIIGIILGNLVPAVAANVGLYTAFTRNRHKTEGDYPTSTAIKDGFKMERDGIPGWVGQYGLQTLIITSLTAAGVDQGTAGSMSIVFGLLFYGGVMKVVAKNRLE